MSHQHSHNHSHSHNHHHVNRFNKAFAISILLNTVFVGIEATYAFASNSSSLLADAGHNLGDVLGLLMAWSANWLLKKPATDKYSYGYRRTSIFAALGNALFLVGTSAVIAYEAMLKLFEPAIIHERTMILVALAGIFINGGTALLFRDKNTHDINIKGAFLHLAYDALISLSVVITGLLILFTKANWLDPAVGLIIVVTILLGSWGLLRDSINLMMDAVPKHIPKNEVETYLKNIPNVSEIHDLHIWGLSSHEVALTAHLVMPKGSLSDADYKRINQELRDNFSIHHTTLQVESGKIHHPCEQQPHCD